MEKSDGTLQVGSSLKRIWQNFKSVRLDLKSPRPDLQVRGGHQASTVKIVVSRVISRCQGKSIYFS